MNPKHRLGQSKGTKSKRNRLFEIFFFNKKKVQLKTTVIANGETNFQGWLMAAVLEMGQHFKTYHISFSCHYIFYL
jgi:hypothetical protein